MGRESSPPKLFTVGVDTGSQHVGLSLFADRDLVSFRRVSSYAGKNSAERLIALAAKVEAALTDMLGFAKCVAPIDCVLELPGKQGGRGRSKSLVGIGMGVGTMNLLAHRRGFRMSYVEVATWSRLGGGKCQSKESRAAVLAKFFPEYRIEDDEGLDTADAIGVAAYHLGIFEGRKKEIDKIIADLSLVR